MRITVSARMNVLLNDLRRLQTQMFEDQQVLSSGIEVVNPSDDPTATPRILDLETQLGRQTQYRRNITTGRNRLSQSDSELNALLDLLNEARSTAVEGANEAGNDVNNAFSADRINNMIGETISIANSRHAGGYLFGGFNTQDSPYNPVYDEETGEIIQVNDIEENMDGIIYQTIEEDRRIPSNLRGTEVFQSGEPGEEGDVFQVLIDLRDALRSNDQEALEELIERIDDVHAQVTSGLSKVGNLVQQYDNALSRIIDDDIQATDALSELQDADMAERIAMYQLHEIALQNTMNIGSSLFQTSLLNFLS
ncbi:hypothetical protein K8I28_10490 [bacterium]|nr:hypothetical protein [bacterium]